MRFRILAAGAAAFFACCVFLPALASAQLDITGYAGGGLGSASMGEACDFTFTAPESCDDSDLGWKVFGGVNLFSYLGAEVGYVSFGDFTDMGDTEDLSFFDTLTIDSAGFYAAGVGRLPMGESFSIYGKVGFHRSSADWKFSDRPDRSGRLYRPATIKFSDTDLFYGIGAEYIYRFGGGGASDPGIGLRIEWERFRWGGDVQATATDGSSSTLQNIRDFNVDLISISAVYQF